jgi:ATP-binding cassette subfamily C protein EexD
MQPSDKRSDLILALKACKSSFLSTGVFSLFINMLMITPSIYMLQVYDRAVGSGSFYTLAMLTLAATFLFLVLGGLEWVRSQVLIRVGAKIDILLNQRLYDAVFKQSLLSGGKINNAQALSDLMNVRQFVTGNGLFAFFDAPWLPIYLALLFFFHWSFGVMGIFAAIALIILAIINEKATHKDLAEANKKAIEESQYTGRNLRNAEIVESMGMLPHLRKRWLARHQDVIALQAEASYKGGLIAAVSKTFRLLLQSLALGLGAYLAMTQEITPGLMIAGSILLGRALAPIDMLIGTWKGFLSAQSAYERLNQLLVAIPAPAETMPLPKPRGHIRAETLFVAPPGGKTPILKGLNFEVEPGMQIGVVGPSAAGKSTLARALLGIWPGYSGAMRLDGADVHGWDRAELGPHIGYLPQDIELFDGTISENIARFGEVNPEWVVEAAQMAGVHDMILHLPDGYDTVIAGVSGVLSGGQMQRVGLARALYGNPSLIILDEPNSNLDDQGEAALAEALNKLKQLGSTVFMITHRPQVLARVDKIMVLREGTIVMFAPPAEVFPKIYPQASPAPAPQLRQVALPAAVIPGVAAR